MEVQYLLINMQITVLAGNVNQPPIANAGDDVYLIRYMDSVVVTGSGIDPEGGTVTYHWSKISGPSQFTIVNPNSATTMIKNLELVFMFFSCW